MIDRTALGAFFSYIFWNQFINFLKKKDEVLVSIDFLCCTFAFYFINFCFHFYYGDFVSQSHNHIYFVIVHKNIYLFIVDKTLSILIFFLSNWYILAPKGYLNTGHAEGEILCLHSCSHTHACRCTPLQEESLCPNTLYCPELFNITFQYVG